MRLDDYELGYSSGHDEGRTIGYMEGYTSALASFEPRLKQMYVEIVELTARISYLEGIVTGKEE